MMMKSLTMAILLVVGVAFMGDPAWTASSGPVTPKPISADHAAGKKAADAGDYENAVEKLEKAVATDPKSADA